MLKINIKIEETFLNFNNIDKVSRCALENQLVSKDYKNINSKLQKGSRPVDIGEKLVKVRRNITIIKTKYGRF